MMYNPDIYCLIYNPYIYCLIIIIIMIFNARQKHYITCHTVAVLLALNRDQQFGKFPWQIKHKDDTCDININIVHVLHTLLNQFKRWVMLLEKNNSYLWDKTHWWHDPCLTGPSHPGFADQLEWLANNLHRRPRKLHWLPTDVDGFVPDLHWFPADLHWHATAEDRWLAPDYDGLAPQHGWSPPGRVRLEQLDYWGARHDDGRGARFRDDQGGGLATRCSHL